MGGDLLHTAFERALKSGGGAVDLIDLIEREFFEGQKMAARPGHG